MRIIQRSEWGARYPDGFADRPLPAKYAWLHHSVTAAPPAIAGFDEDAAAVRLLEQIGQQRFGGGISYTFALPPSGRIFEGHSVWRQGSHTKNHNDDSIGIVLIGDYRVHPATGAQEDALAWLLNTLHDLRQLQQPQLTGGHRDAEPPGYTECPGDAAWSQIPFINALAADPTLGRDFKDMTKDEYIAAQKALHDQHADDVTYGILRAMRHEEVRSLIGKAVAEGIKAATPPLPPLPPAE